MSPLDRWLQYRDIAVASSRRWYLPGSDRDCVAYAMPGRSCDCGRDDALGIALANLKRKLDA